MGKSKVDQFLNKVFKSNSSGDFKVIDYTNASNILIQFLTTGAIVKTASKAVRND